MTGQICGNVDGTEIGWAEAIRIRIEHRIDNLWLLMEPSIWVGQTDDDHTYYTSREFIRQRLARRYNTEWNKIIDAWVSIITGGEKECTLRAFGISDGCDAVFNVSRTTAFSWREKVS
jgi:hypothetical protein